MKRKMKVPPPPLGELYQFFSSEKHHLYSRDKSQSIAYAQGDLRLCWSHIPHCWKSHALAHYYLSVLTLRKTQKHHVCIMHSKIMVWIKFYRLF